MSSYLKPGDHLENVTTKCRFGGDVRPVTVYCTKSESIYVVCCVSLVVVEIDCSLWIEATPRPDFGSVRVFPITEAVEIVPKA